jgi:hypothetical protein
MAEAWETRGINPPALKKRDLGERRSYARLVTTAKHSQQRVQALHLATQPKGKLCPMGKKIRLGRLEREQTRLAARWRASQVNDNLHISLHDVTRESDIRSPMAVAHLQSKGARGGSSPYGRTERFERKQSAKPQRFSVK